MCCASRFSTGGKGDLLGQKSCRTKVLRTFRIFLPDFLPNFPPNLSRIFVLSFPGNVDHKKITNNPRHISMPNHHANTKKHSQRVSGEEAKSRFGQQIQANAQGPMKQNASSGAQSGASRLEAVAPPTPRTRKPRQSAHAESSQGDLLLENPELIISYKSGP